MNQQHTKLLMSFAALALGAVGLILSFFPDELVSYFAIDGKISIVLQLMGALYFGFALLNWMARQSVIGGIYQKPLVLGNFTHFLVGGLALAKFLSVHSGNRNLWIVTGLYVLFGLGFGYLFFNNPLPQTGTK